MSVRQQCVHVLIILAMAFPAQAAAPAGRFVVSDDSLTVTDAKTGLVWQRNVPSGKLIWADARAWCRSNSSNLAGTGWRLPSVEELATIVDTALHFWVNGYSPGIDATAFPDTPYFFFWSSTPSLFPSSSAWTIAFYGGASAHGRPQTDLYYVRCVR